MSPKMTYPRPARTGSPKPSHWRGGLDSGRSRLGPHSATPRLDRRSPSAAWPPRPSCTSDNIVTIMAAVCAFHGIPLALGLTVLDHENMTGLHGGFGHSDGLMQTNCEARKDMIPRIPLPLKLQLLELPANDGTRCEAGPALIGDRVQPPRCHASPAPSSSNCSSCRRTTG